MAPLAPSLVTHPPTQSHPLACRPWHDLSRWGIPSSETGTATDCNPSSCTDPPHPPPPHPTPSLACRLWKDASRWGIVEDEGDLAFFALWPPWSPHRPELPDSLLRLAVPKKKGDGQEVDGEPVLRRTATEARGMGLGAGVGIRGLL